jgi:hypothetical protein
MSFQVNDYIAHNSFNQYPYRVVGVSTGQQPKYKLQVVFLGASIGDVITVSAKDIDKNYSKVETPIAVANWPTSMDEEEW